jgi:hypothetical protein
MNELAPELTSSRAPRDAPEAPAPRGGVGRHGVDARDDRPGLQG